MKKILSMVLILALACGFATAALAKEYEIPMQGMLMDIPDSFEAILDDNTQTDTLVLFQGADDAARYEFAMGESEKHGEKWLNEMSEAEQDELFAEYTEDIYNPSLEIVQSDTLTWMLIHAGNGDEIVYVTVIYGSLCHVGALRVDGEKLTDAQIAIVEQMAMSLRMQDLDELMAQ